MINLQKRNTRFLFKKLKSDIFYFINKRLEDFKSDTGMYPSDIVVKIKEVKYSGQPGINYKIDDVIIKFEE